MSERITPLEKEVAALLDISKNYGKKNKSAFVKRKSTLLLASSLFKKHALDEKDILIVAILLENTFEEDKGMKTKEVLNWVEKDRKAVFVAVKRIERLKELGIIDFVAGEECLRIDDDDTEDAGGGRSSNVSLFRTTIVLSGSFLDKICGTDIVVSSDDIVTPYRDNVEYLCDQFERVGILEGDDDLFLRPRVRRMLKRGGRVLPRKDSRRPDEGKLGKIEKRIIDRLKMTNRVFPFGEFKKKKNLTGKEELVVLVLLEREASGHPVCDIDDLLDIVSKTRYERLTDRKLMEKSGRLVKEKIILTEKQPSKLDDGEEEYVWLNPAVKADLLEERKRNNKRSILKDEKFFEIITPSVPLEKVILHPKTHENINLAIDMIQGEVSLVLSGWGIKGIDLIDQTASKKRYRPVTMLFSGPPGTGKTLTANAIAFALKRKLLTLDCSKILGAYVGESEKNTKKIFDRYREIAKNLKNPPVLLLNEADQFLHKRIEASKSADHMYNQMQNIFLEQLERFDGILVATTNLVESLDPAFARRFHHKIEFKRPGHQERHKLWVIHISEKAPLADDVDLKYLAERYNLSGGEISVAVRNAATRAARRNYVISQADFIRACDDELTGSFDEKSGHLIGF